MLFHMLVSTWCLVLFFKELFIYLGHLPVSVLQGTNSFSNLTSAFEIGLC